MFLGAKRRPARKADNFTAICEPNVWTMWDAQHLTTPLGTMACHGDNFTFIRFSEK
jgi:hypothetical protein